MANIDLGNLTRYDGKIKEYVEDKYLSKNTANWQMTEKAGAVNCYPVPDTELEPIIDFSFKEVPPAEGEKSPTNPSTIQGVSSIAISQLGKNLLAYDFATNTVANGTTLTRKGLTSSNNNGIYSISGSVTSDENIYITHYTEEPNIFKLPAGTYTLSGYNAPENYVDSTYIMMQLNDFFADPDKILVRCKNQAVTFTIDSVQLCNIYIRVASGTEFPEGFICTPQLEAGDIATAFEPSSITNYTYSLDNVYYGGKVNLATGEMVVTHGVKVFDGTGITWNRTEKDNTTEFYVSTTLYPNRAVNTTVDSVCSHFSRLYSTSQDVVGYGIYSLSLGGYFFYPGNVTVTEWNTFLADQYANGTPVTVTYNLENPYIVQLDPIQIKSLTALDKNTPRLNTLYTDADSIQVGYQKHPARTAYELENAILALGGGE